MNRLAQLLQSSCVMATILVFGISPLVANGEQYAHPLDPALQMAEASLQHIQLYR